MNSPPLVPVSPPAGGPGIFAARGWLKNYHPSWLRADLAAAFTLAAYLLPSALGDATLIDLIEEPLSQPTTNH